VLLIFGLAGIRSASPTCFVGQLDDLPRWIRTGELDVLLLRPLPVSPADHAPTCSCAGLGRVLVGLLVARVRADQGTIAWSPVTVLLLVSTPAGRA